MYQHMSSKQLKKSARARLSANQGVCVGATASYLGIIAAVYVMTALTTGVSSSVTIIIQSLCGLLISVLSGVISAGYQYMFLKPELYRFHFYLFLYIRLKHCPRFFEADLAHPDQ